MKKSKYFSTDDGIVRVLKDSGIEFVLLRRDPITRDIEVDYSIDEGGESAENMMDACYYAMDKELEKGE